MASSASNLIHAPAPFGNADAAVALQIPTDDALLGMLFSWVENQMLSCVK
jgi:urease accessory protein UreF